MPTPETLAQTLTLAQFLKQPEVEPGLEYINGAILSKVIPKGKHSAIQTLLTALINSVLKTSKLAWAFTELRCTFMDKSLIPDISVFRWERIPCDLKGEIADMFMLPPDWMIEILSPGQSMTQLTQKILYCLEAGTEMGWLIHPEERSVLIYVPQQNPMIFNQDNPRLLVPEFAQNLEINIQDIFAYLIKN